MKAMGVTCLGFWFFEFSTPWLLSVMGICFTLTWLEAVLGVCVGCWIYNGLFGCDPCETDPGDGLRAFLARARIFLGRAV